MVYTFSVTATRTKFNRISSTLYRSGSHSERVITGVLLPVPGHRAVGKGIAGIVELPGHIRGYIKVTLFSVAEIGQLLVQHHSF